jgi:hypothetical protein
MMKKELKDVENGDWFYDGNHWYKKISYDENKNMIQASQIGVFTSFWFEPDIIVEVRNKK